MHKVIHLVVDTFDQGWRSWIWGGAVSCDWTQDWTLDMCVRTVVRCWYGPGLRPRAGAWRWSDATVARPVGGDVCWHELAHEGWRGPVSAIKLYVGFDDVDHIIKGLMASLSVWQCIISRWCKETKEETPQLEWMACIGSKSVFNSFIFFKLSYRTSRTIKGILIVV
jgi:hypothetical protein